MRGTMRGTMRVAIVLRALRGLYVPALLLFAVPLVPGARVGAQAGATSHTLRSASGSFLGAAGEVALPVVVVLGVLYFILRARRQRR